MKSFKKTQESESEYEEVRILREYGINLLKYMGHQFCHFAMIYTKRSKSIVNVLSYGYNHIRDGKSIHAEVDAINNLRTSLRKKLKGVNLLVIRLLRSPEHALAQSKCCMRCCECIFKIPSLKGYRIDQVLYSNVSGEIEKHHPIDLLIEDDYHVSVYYSKRKYKPKIRSKVLMNPTSKVRLFLNKRKVEKEDVIEL